MKNGGNLLNSVGNEKYKHTSLICDECGSPVVMDIFKEEYYCIYCGLLYGYRYDELEDML